MVSVELHFSLAANPAATFGWGWRCVLASERRRPAARARLIQYRPPRHPFV